MDLSTIHGPDYFVLSAKARREFLSAIQEAFNMEFSNPAERRSITQLAMRLCHLWGKTTLSVHLHFIELLNQPSIFHFFFFNF